MSNRVNASGLIEETGEVVELQGGWAVIETRSRSACDHCATGNACGTSVLASVFGQRRNRVRLNNHLGVSVGDNVVIGIHESVLLSTAILAYMLPLLLMIGCALLAANLLESSDDMTFIASMLGLFAGMAMSNRIMGDKDYQARDIMLLRNANEAVIRMANEKTV